MRCEKFYYANDGTKFVGANAYTECAEYERTLQEEKYAPLKPYVQFYNSKGEPIRIYKGAYYATFVHLNNTPLDDDLYNMWLSLVPEEIADSCYDYNDCWWVNINDIWVSWNELKKDFYRYADQIEKIEKNNS